MIKETSYELAKEIPSGSKIAIFKDSSVPMTLGLNMIKSGITDLEIVTVPTGGLLVDLLIGSGCVTSVETSGVSLGEAGPAPRFTEAIKNGSIFRDTKMPKLDPKFDRAMICGSPAMLKETSEILNEKGFIISAGLGRPGDYVIERAFVGE